MPRRLIDLSAHEFENLTYDILRLSGFENLTWRTPGADGGRDIDGIVFITDASGQRDTQRWYVECKRYDSSISWPILWQKLAYADVKKADFLLLSTNSNPSPQCETQIAEWNRTARSPRVRVWRSYDLDHLIRLHGVVALKYGLREPTSAFDYDFGGLSELLTKTVQASYVANSLGLESNRALEAAAAISELLTLRIKQVKHLGRFPSAAEDFEDSLYPWVAIGGELAGFDPASLRAVCAFLRFAARLDRVALSVCDGSVILRSSSKKLDGVGGSAWKAIVSIEPWLLTQMTLSEDKREVRLKPTKG